MTHIGIDPGKKGAMAIMTGDSIITIPFDEKAYITALREFNLNVRCVLEHVGAMPGQGVTSMFSFGQNFGFIQGVLQSFDIPYELVRPQKWKKEFSITSDKNSSIQVAHRLFPNTDLRRTDKCRTDDDGIAEALLMAEYARRHL